MSPPQSGRPSPRTADPRLAAALGRLDRLIDWERRDRSIPGQAMRVSVAPARDLLERLGHPERRFRSVHVAGTKGKGSVAALVEAGLGRAGLAAGRYASPHVEHVGERVTVGGAPLPDAALGRALERALDAREAALADGGPGAEATWFDAFTAGAFLALAEAGVEWAVVECGLGGRLDSTNTLAAEVCVVTNVDLEHTAILGDTRAAIAAEKGGILKGPAPLVTGVPADDEAGAVLDALAARQGAPVRRPGALPEGATLEDRNAALAGLVLDELGRAGVTARARGRSNPEGGPPGTRNRERPEDRARTRPLGAWLLDQETRRAARLPGRMERFLMPPGALGTPGSPSRPVPVVLDGAHVASSLRAVLDELQGDATLPGRCTVILGLSADKDAPSLLKVLAGRVDRLLCTSVGAGPYRTPEDLLDEARRAGSRVAEKASSPRVALERALEPQDDPGWVLVTGSLHLVGAVRPWVRCALGEPAC